MKIEVSRERILYFFVLLDRKFNEDSKNVLKTVIFVLQMGFTSNFSLTVLSNCVFGSLYFDTFFSLNVPNFVVFFQVIG